MKKFIEEFGEEGLQWLLEDEVMPLCREVVIPMKRRWCLYLTLRKYKRNIKDDVR